jgi:hypothetical protein
MSNYTPGDHLSTPRGVYTHHGLYVGDGQVIHYSGFAGDGSSGAVECVTLKAFANGESISKVPFMIRVYDRDEAVERAWSKLGADNYNLLWNNCETFVYWCITGVPVSPQVVNAFATAYQAYKLTQTTKATVDVVNAVRQVAAAEAVRTSAPTVAKMLTTAAGGTAAAGLLTGGAATTTAATAALLTGGVVVAPVALVAAGALGVAAGVAWLLDW